jgi:hypothetical protein
MEQVERATRGALVEQGRARRFDLWAQRGDRAWGEHLRHQPADARVVRGFEREQRPPLVLVERRPPLVRFGAAERRVVVAMRVRAPEAAVAQRLVHVCETREHPLRGRLIPEYGGRLAQLGELWVRVGEERRVVDGQAQIHRGHADSNRRQWSASSSQLMGET